MFHSIAVGLRCYGCCFRSKLGDWLWIRGLKCWRQSVEPHQIDVRQRPELIFAGLLNPLRLIPRKALLWVSLLRGYHRLRFRNRFLFRVV